MNLQEYRAQIDAIDDQITDLLKRRFALSQKIGEYKKQNGIPVCDKTREEEILARAKGKSGDLAAPVTAVYQTILEQSKRAQNK